MRRSYSLHATFQGLFPPRSQREAEYVGEISIPTPTRRRWRNLRISVKLPKTFFSANNRVVPSNQLWSCPLRTGHDVSALPDRGLIRCFARIDPASGLHIHDPYKAPGPAARNGELWEKAVNYEAEQAPDILLVPDFEFVSASQVARHLWPCRESVDSHKIIEAWRKHPEYRGDAVRSWFRKNPGKVAAKLIADL